MAFSIIIQAGAPGGSVKVVEALSATQKVVVFEGGLGAGEGEESVRVNVQGDPPKKFEWTFDPYPPGDSEQGPAPSSSGASVLGDGGALDF